MKDRQFELTDAEMATTKSDFISWAKNHGLSPVLLPNGVFEDNTHQIFFMQYAQQAAKLNRSESRNNLRLNEALADIVMRRVDSGEDALDVMKEAGIIHCFVMLSRAFLTEQDITNYVEMSASLGDGESDDENFVINIRRKSGLTPHFLRVQAETQRDQARHVVAEMKDLLLQIYGNYADYMKESDRSLVFGFIDTDDSKPVRESIKDLRKIAAISSNIECEFASVPVSVIRDILAILDTLEEGTIVPGIEVALNVLDEVKLKVSNTLEVDEDIEPQVCDRLVGIFTLIEEMIGNRLQEHVVLEKSKRIQSGAILRIL